MKPLRHEAERFGRDVKAAVGEMQLDQRLEQPVVGLGNAGDRSDGNPRPEVATFHFTALSGTAAATTRMRLAKTQNVIALAKMADGSVYMDKKEVKVTIGGCGG